RRLLPARTGLDEEAQRDHGRERILADDDGEAVRQALGARRVRGGRRRGRGEDGRQAEQDERTPGAARHRVPPPGRKRTRAKLSSARYFCAIAWISAAVTLRRRSRYWS